MSQHILVFNSGSSSIKFQLLDLHSPSVEPEVVGLIEKIGEPVGHIDITVGEQNQQLDESIPDHSAGLKHAFDMMQHMGASLDDLYGVGHRVVQGGDVFTGPQIVDDSVLKSIKDLIPLAPLHNPAELVGIEVAMDLLPGVPQVAVFDTSFFNTMPEKAYRYAIPKKLADDNGIRRYGFHGTSHEYVSKKVPPLLGKPTGEVNQITLHLGNGASAAAIRGGKAEDTTMGLTPLAGLVMGTRSGDIDPSILFHLSRQAGLDVDQLDTLLNRESGVKGISGVNDFRELAKLVAQGDANAIAAYEIYIYQMRRFIGSYMLNLGRIDAITFTAGVGENDAAVRRDALADLEHFGIKIDDERNNAKKTSEGRLISTDDSEVKVFVIPTNEELAIAQITGERVSSAG